MLSSKTSSRSSGGTICFFWVRWRGGFSGGFGLLFELDALEGEEILSAEDGSLRVR